MSWSRFRVLQGTRIELDKGVLHIHMRLILLTSVLTNAIAPGFLQSSNRRPCIPIACILVTEILTGRR